MKPLELTQEQEKRLFKMCEVLFPDYQHNLADIDYIAFYSVKEDTFTSIHWFEFCMTYLPRKLSECFTKANLGEGDYTNIQIPFWFIQEMALKINPFNDKDAGIEYLFEHPVDYLYTQFQKLPKKLNYGYNQRKQVNSGILKG